MGVRMLAIYGNPTGLLDAGALIGSIDYPATALILLRWRSTVLPPERAGV